MATEQETQANYRHCRTAADDLERFVTWVKERNDCSQAEKHRFVSLIAEYTKANQSHWARR